MQFQFSKSIPPILWALALSTVIPFGDAAWAESSPRDAFNRSEPVVTADETIADQPIEFRTLVPDRPITLPKEGKQKAIEKFGIRITNHAKTEKVFAPYFVKFSVLDENGELIRFVCGRLGTKMIEQSSFRSLKPGESVEFLYPAAFWWTEEGLLLGYQTPDGGGCSVNGIKAGKYSLSIDYDVERNASILNNIDLWHRWNIDPQSVWKEGVRSIPATLLLIESQNGQTNP